MESKWFIIIAMILSLLYKKYKERQEMKEGVESESEKESMWNMEDFVAKLERQFNPNSGNEMSTSTPKPHRAVVEVEPVFRKEEMMDSNPEYSEDKINDSPQSFETLLVATVADSPPFAFLDIMRVQLDDGDMASVSKDTVAKLQNCEWV